jgi:hypothetical protein
MRRKTVDPACLTLAEHFLHDEPTLQRGADDLAAHIQQAIEDWIEDEKIHPEGEP